MTKDRVLRIVQESFDALSESELIAEPLTATDGTELLGPGSLLDSIAFVTFMVELEDRLRPEIGDDGTFNLSITEIHDFNPEKSTLSVGTLTDYIVHLTSPR